jgi:RNA polymerase sigma-54 factor
MHNQGQYQSQKQGQKILPQQIQMLNLLQLSTLEMAQRIISELEENPALENDDLSENPDNTEGGNEEELSSSEADYDDPIDYYNFEEENPNDYAATHSKSEDTYELTAVQVSSFQENLKQQLSLRDLDPRQLALGEYLIDAIDDDGYLRRSLEDIADDLSFNLNVFIAEKELEEVLMIIHALDPIGIGSRDLTEFLMLQLREMARRGADIAVACAIVDGYVNEVAQKQYDKVKNALQVSDGEFRLAVQLISQLNPKPVSGLSRPEDITRHIAPDFIVLPKEGGNGFEITIMGIGASDLRINHKYNDLLFALETAPTPTREQKSNAQYLRSKVNAAQWFIDALKQREDSLTRTIHTIVALQQPFFTTGDVKQLRPMILKDVADRVDLDISTISRVTSTRYVQTDFGIIPLKELFTEGVLTEDGQWVSNRAIQETVKEIIEKEDKFTPLTDQEIADQLAQFSYKIARRTVAKYREGMNIPNAQLRKEA